MTLEELEKKEPDLAEWLQMMKRRYSSRLESTRSPLKRSRMRSKPRKVQRGTPSK